MRVDIRFMCDGRNPLNPIRANAGMAVADAARECRRVSRRVFPFDDQEIVAAAVRFHEWNGYAGRFAHESVSLSGTSSARSSSEHRRNFSINAVWSLGSAPTVN